jgi:AcrR family transcriptional regulator
VSAWEASLRGLSSEAVAANQRRRILSAVGVALYRNGYRYTTVEHILELASVSRRTFYSLFDGKADVFCAAHAEALALLDERVRAACGSEEEWPQQVEAAVAAALRWATAEPDRAYLLVAEPLTAGPRMLCPHDLLVDRFASRLRLGRAFSPIELPSTLEEYLLGGFANMVAARLTQDRPSLLPRLAPELTDFLCSPFLGDATPAAVCPKAEAIGV